MIEADAAGRSRLQLNDPDAIRDLEVRHPQIFNRRRERRARQEALNLLAKVDNSHDTCKGSKVVDFNQGFKNGKRSSSESLNDSDSSTDKSRESLEKLNGIVSRRRNVYEKNSLSTGHKTTRNEASSSRLLSLKERLENNARKLNQVLYETSPFREKEPGTDNNVFKSTCNFKVVPARDEHDLSEHSRRHNGNVSESETSGSESSVDTGNSMERNRGTVEVSDKMDTDKLKLNGESVKELKVLTPLQSPGSQADSAIDVESVSEVSETHAERNSGEVGHWASYFDKCEKQGSNRLELSALSSQERQSDQHDVHNRPLHSLPNFVGNRAIKSLQSLESEREDVRERSTISSPSQRPKLQSSFKKCGPVKADHSLCSSASSFSHLNEQEINKPVQPVVNGVSSECHAISTTNEVDDTDPTIKIPLCPPSSRSETRPRTPKKVYLVKKARFARHVPTYGHVTPLRSNSSDLNDTKACDASLLVDMRFSSSLDSSTMTAMQDVQEDVFKFQQVNLKSKSLNDIYAEEDGSRLSSRKTQNGGPRYRSEDVLDFSSSSTDHPVNGELSYPKVDNITLSLKPETQAPLQTLSMDCIGESQTEETSDRNVNSQTSSIIDPSGQASKDAVSLSPKKYLSEVKIFPKSVLKTSQTSKSEVGGIFEGQGVANLTSVDGKDSLKLETSVSSDCGSPHLPDSDTEFFREAEFLDSGMKPKKSTFQKIFGVKKGKYNPAVQDKLNSVPVTSKPVLNEKPVEDSVTYKAGTPVKPIGNGVRQKNLRFSVLDKSNDDCIERYSAEQIKDAHHLQAAVLGSTKESCETDNQTKHLTVATGKGSCVDLNSSDDSSSTCDIFATSWPETLKKVSKTSTENLSAQMSGSLHGLVSDIFRNSPETDMDISWSLNSEKCNERNQNIETSYTSTGSCKDSVFDTPCKNEGSSSFVSKTQNMEGGSEKPPSSPRASNKSPRSILKASKCRSDSAAGNPPTRASESLDLSMSGSGSEPVDSVKAALAQCVPANQLSLSSVGFDADDSFERRFNQGLNLNESGSSFRSNSVSASPRSVWSECKDSQDIDNSFEDDFNDSFTPRSSDKTPENESVMTDESGKSVGSRENTTLSDEEVDKIFELAKDPPSFGESVEDAGLFEDLTQEYNSEVDLKVDEIVDVNAILKENHSNKYDGKDNQLLRKIDSADQNSENGIPQPVFSHQSPQRAKLKQTSVNESGHVDRDTSSLNQHVESDDIGMSSESEVIRSAFDFLGSSSEAEMLTTQQKLQMLEDEDSDEDANLASSFRILSDLRKSLISENEDILFPDMVEPTDSSELTTQDFKAPSPSTISEDEDSSFQIDPKPAGVYAEIQVDIHQQNVADSDDGSEVDGSLDMIDDDTLTNNPNLMVDHIEESACEVLTPRANNSGVLSDPFEKISAVSSIDYPDSHHNIEETDSSKRKISLSEELQLPLWDNFDVSSESSTPRGIFQPGLEGDLDDSSFNVSSSSCELSYRSDASITPRAQNPSSLGSHTSTTSLGMIQDAYSSCTAEKPNQRYIKKSQMTKTRGVLRRQEAQVIEEDMNEEVGYESEIRPVSSETSYEADDSLGPIPVRVVSNIVKGIQNCPGNTTELSEDLNSSTASEVWFDNIDSKVLEMNNSKALSVLSDRADAYRKISESDDSAINFSDSSPRTSVKDSTFDLPDVVQLEETSLDSECNELQQLPTGVSNVDKSPYARISNSYCESSTDHSDCTFESFTSVSPYDSTPCLSKVSSTPKSLYNSISADHELTCDGIEAVTDPYATINLSGDSRRCSSVSNVSSPYATLNDLSMSPFNEGLLCSSRDALVEGSRDKSLDVSHEDARHAIPEIRIIAPTSDEDETVDIVKGPEVKDLYSKVMKNRLKGDNSETEDIQPLSPEIKVTDQDNVSIAEIDESLLGACGGSEEGLSEGDHGPPLPSRGYQRSISTPSTLDARERSRARPSLFSNFRNKMKKAMSMDRGLNVVENEQGKPGKKEKGEKVKDKHKGEKDKKKKGDSNMKKASSLKSLTAIFGKKNKEKLSLPPEGETEDGAEQPDKEVKKKKGFFKSKKKRPITLKDIVAAPFSTFRWVGIESIDPDGTQIVRLLRPKQGPIGFYIAKGTANYDYGIFVSRFTDEHGKLLSGILDIGDEILEVNRQPVKDLSLDEVYTLMAEKEHFHLKVFPIAARKEV